VAASSSNVRRPPRKLSAVSDSAISSGLCMSPRRVAKQVTSSNSSSYIQNRLLATLASSQNDFMSPSEPTFTEVLCTPYIDGTRVSLQKKQQHQGLGVRRLTLAKIRSGVLLRTLQVLSAGHLERRLAPR
jgi:hypothetical protein